jgi:2'-5' RNA ligase
MTPKTDQLGYVTIEIEDDHITQIKNLLSTICTSNDFYYSDVVPRIAGDVTDKLHLTLFYGLLHKQIDKEKLLKELNNINLEELTLENIALKQGYQGLYQILWLTVLDSDNYLLNLSTEIGKFNPSNYDPHYTFLPHITLAYVRPEFKLKTELIIPKTLKIRQIKYFKS